MPYTSPSVSSTSATREVFSWATPLATAAPLDRGVARVHGNYRPCNASPNRTLAPIFSTELL